MKLTDERLRVLKGSFATCAAFPMDNESPTELARNRDVAEALGELLTLRGKVESLVDGRLREIAGGAYCDKEPYRSMAADLRKARNSIATAEAEAVRATLRAEKAEGEAKALRAELDTLQPTAHATWCGVRFDECEEQELRDARKFLADPLQNIYDSKTGCILHGVERDYFVKRHLAKIDAMLAGGAK